jgi:U6 snRNA-associated Sm-like protein LSm7
MSHGYKKSGGGSGAASSAAPGGGGGGTHKKESNAEMAKLLDTTVRVKCLGGRELRGTLRGYDDLINLVLDDCDEFIRGM